MRTGLTHSSPFTHDVSQVGRIGLQIAQLLLVACLVNEVDELDGLVIVNMVIITVFVLFSRQIHHFLIDVISNFPTDFKVAN